MRGQTGMTTMERIETVIVGGGQAGLATSYLLNEQGHEHVVLEQAAQAGNVWRNERWDSFTLVSPNWALRMPGAEYDGPDRGAFMPRNAVVAYFEEYVERFRLPVQYGTRVTSIAPRDGHGYLVVTPGRTYLAEQVVVATGFEQMPRVPGYAAAMSPEIVQMHSSQYRNPEALPPGGVLVVGSAQSGAQIAEELYQAGRAVFLSVSSAGRAPRCYRGRDIFDWLYDCGFLDSTPDRLPMPKERFRVPHVSGTQGGHSLNLHQFRRDGVTLLGHVRGAEGDIVSLAPDLHQTLEQVDQFERQMQQMVDGYIQAAGIEAPEETLPQLRDGFGQPILETLDLKAGGVGTIIWATGYRHDYGLVQAPVLDGDGFPVQNGGVSAWPGLYFVGMPWMPSLKTGNLVGVGDAARHVASHLLERRAGRGALVRN
jgi:putative flavoprotein involved in K+ transport